MLSRPVLQFSVLCAVPSSVLYCSSVCCPVPYLLQLSVLSRPVLQFSVLSRPVLQFSVLLLSRPVLQFSVLSRPVLQFSVLSRPVLHFSVLYVLHGPVFWWLILFSVPRPAAAAGSNRGSPKQQRT